MATTPSIKGSALQPLVERVEDHLESGSLTRSGVEAGLEPAYLAVLESPVMASGWYPIGVANRLADILLEGAWQGRREEMRAHAVGAGAEFISQKAYAGYWEQAARQEERAGEIITALSRLLFNFSRWRFLGSLCHDWRVEVSEAAPFGHAFLIPVEAFFEHVFSNLLGAHVAVSMQRPRVDKIVFHGTSDG